MTILLTFYFCITGLALLSLVFLIWEQYSIFGEVTIGEVLLGIVSAVLPIVQIFVVISALIPLVDNLITLFKKFLSIKILKKTK